MSAQIAYADLVQRKDLRRFALGLLKPYLPWEDTGLGSEIKKYGITVTDYCEMWRNQRGLCRACGLAEGKTRGCGKWCPITQTHDIHMTVRLCVDHDHAMEYDTAHSDGVRPPFPSALCPKEAVRGLLCSKCNLLLGHTYDDPNYLRLLASYLENTTMARPCSAMTPERVEIAVVHLKNGRTIPEVAALMGVVKATLVSALGHRAARLLASEGRAVRKANPPIHRAKPVDPAVEEARIKALITGDDEEVSGLYLPAESLGV